MNIKSKDDIMYKEYSECKILKEHMDNYLAKKELLKTRKELLFDYCNNLKSVDEFKNCMNIELNGLNITKTYLSHLYRMKSKDDLMYQEYSECKILKEHMDNYLANIKKGSISLEDKWNLFYEYCDNERKVPPSTFEYNGFDIGKFYANIRRPIESNKDVRYIELSKYEFIKNDIDKMLQKRSKTGTFEVMANKLFEYCDKYGLPTRTTNEILYNWFREQLKRIDENTELSKYKFDYLSKNKLVKDYLDEQQNSIRKRDKWVINFNKVKEFIEKNKRLPCRSKKNGEDEIKLGQWIQEAKSRYDKKLLSDKKRELFKELNDLILKF
jgi:hypothetical protein